MICLELIVMYVGIIVDIRNFMLRIGFRIFDVVSYLCVYGVDIILM